MTKHGKDNMSVNAKGVIIQLIESRHMTLKITKTSNILNKSTISNCLITIETTMICRKQAAEERPKYVYKYKFARCFLNLPYM